MSSNAPSPVFYTVLQRKLHWMVIVLLAGQYLLQGFMRDALSTIDAGNTLGFTEFLVTTLHTWGGAGIAVLMLWRWQLRTRTVPLNGGRLSRRHHMLVKIHHVSLYVTTIGMALTGGMHYYLGWQFAERWHELGKWLLLGLVLVHVCGAVWHARLNSTVLRRMMGRGS